MPASAEDLPAPDRPHSMMLPPRVSRRKSVPLLDVLMLERSAPELESSWRVAGEESFEWTTTPAPLAPMGVMSAFQRCGRASATAHAGSCFCAEESVVVLGIPIETYVVLRECELGQRDAQTCPLVHATCRAPSPLLLLNTTLRARGRASCTVRAPRVDVPRRPSRARRFKWPHAVLVSARTKEGRCKWLQDPR